MRTRGQQQIAIQRAWLLTLLSVCSPLSDRSLPRESERARSRGEIERSLSAIVISSSEKKATSKRRSRCEPARLRLRYGGVNALAQKRQSPEEILEALLNEHHTVFRVVGTLAPADGLEPPT